MLVLLKKYKHYQYQIDYLTFNAIKYLNTWHPEGYSKECDHKDIIPDTGSIIEFRAIKDDKLLQASYYVAASWWYLGTGYDLCLKKLEEGELN